MKQLTVIAPSAQYIGLQGEKAAYFLGIPYAKAPLGELRFRPPQLLDLATHTIIDATRQGKSPPQRVWERPSWAAKGPVLELDEDCLNLNVFTPEVDAKSRPVIVHVFGGGFEGGSANGGYLDGEAFVAMHDVVLVRVNFRVGALGFLDLRSAMMDETLTANAGLLDLIAALKWVQTNINAFGGNPEKVTLVGLSSGAFMIASLFGVPASKGLFQRAWLMSGSASRIIAQETANAMAEKFLLEAGIKPGDKQALAECPIETLLKAQTSVIATHLGVRNAPGGWTLGIVADGQVLEKHPLVALKAAERTDINLVLGWTRDEARMWYSFGIMPAPQDRENLLKTVRLFHTDGAQVLEEHESRYPEASLAELEERFLSETIYKKPALATAQAQHDAGGMSWVYEFAWEPRIEEGRLGASHGFDEAFVFGQVNPERVPYTQGSPEALPLADKMSLALISFVREGDPDWELFKGSLEYIQVFD
ncbi:MAG: carboxylesterase/lipase family protein [Trueperaceae bacterium]|nr:carboxylesterase/lipase family protein [Trueperaceae bacterium]